MSCVLHTNEQRFYNDDGLHVQTKCADCREILFDAGGMGSVLRGVQPRTGDSDFDAILAECVATMATKGKDYTQGNDDRLHNFNTAAGFLGLTPRQVLGVYFYKHIAAIFSHMKSGKVESEPIQGRIVDAINYLLLYAKMVK